MKRKGLTPAEHVELGALLKRVRRDLHEAGAMCRCYGQLAGDLFDLADRGLMSPRAFLEKQLIAAVARTEWLRASGVRDVYFGTLADAKAE